jgi:hypothetical protein
VTEEEPRRPGKRIVTAMYLIIVGITGVFGFVIGTISPGQIDPQLFGVVPLPANPFGVALYGMITIGLLLGLLLLGVRYVSKKTGAAGE